MDETEKTKRGILIKVVFNLFQFFLFQPEQDQRNFFNFWWIDARTDGLNL